MPGTIDAGRPRGLFRFAVRLPIWLYRARLGWLLGGRFLMLTHVGRTSGQRRRVVLEVVRHDADSDTYYVASAWGAKADWYRNVRRTPRVTAEVGRRRFEATARMLSSDEEAERVLLDYARRHPAAFRALMRWVTGAPVREVAAACQNLAQSIPLVALSPVGS